MSEIRPRRRGRAAMSNSTRIFTNELGNEICITVGLSPEPDGLCLVQIKGPHSMHTNLITRMELAKLAEAISEAHALALKS